MKGKCVCAWWEMSVFEGEGRQGMKGKEDDKKRGAWHVGTARTCKSRREQTFIKGRGSEECYHDLCSL